jgi:pimeloyl-ACP methyl ester carboxylesterase
MPENTPVMMILHGIGGGSDSRTARLLSDAIRAHGWRVCVYNRRGHGDSTLLPGPLRPPAPKSPSKVGGDVFYMCRAGRARRQGRNRGERGR